MTSNRSRVRQAALTAAASATICAAMGAMAPVHAASVSLPDPTQTANLHITKEAAPSAGTAGNGTQQDPGNAPLANVQFTVKKVDGIDLTTQAGWTATSTLSTAYNNDAPGTPAAAEAELADNGYGSLTEDGSKSTASDGTVDFTGLDLGLYLVEETAVPKGTVPSAPFLVTLPMTKPGTGATDRSSWMYDVYVYPKNAQTNVVKTVDDENAVAEGQTMTYTIKGDIPASAANGADEVDGYAVKDLLDSALTYQSATVALSDGTTLVKDTDYSLTTASVAGGKSLITVTFLPAGLDKLTAARDGDAQNGTTTRVVVTLDATANTTGVIPNTAYIYPDKNSVDSSTGTVPGTPEDPGTPSTPVDTKYGSITIQKTNEDGSKHLEGAVFKVYRTEADAKDGTNAISVTDADGTTTDSWTTGGSDGLVTISGLRYSDFADGVTVHSGDAGYQDYWLVETQAPTGYELLSEPLKFDIDAATSGSTTDIDLQVADSAANGGFALPFTGGSGEWLVWTGGSLLMGGALILGGLRRRRHNA